MKKSQLLSFSRSRCFGYLAISAYNGLVTMEEKVLEIQWANVETQYQRAGPT